MTFEKQDIFSEPKPAATAKFPEISMNGDKVNAKMYIEPGTGFAEFAAFAVVITVILIGIIVSYGIFLIILIIAYIYTWYSHKRTAAIIHGSGICVSETQFPEIHRCVKDFSQRLDLKADVDVYIIEANTVNAAVLNCGRKNIVIITNELIHGSLACGHPEALAFVIGHELAHIALNYNRLFHSWMARNIKKLRK